MKLIMSIQRDGQSGWEELGSWDEGDISHPQDLKSEGELWEKADQIPGLIRVVDELGNKRFGRLSRCARRRASDDCHTYS